MADEKQITFSFMSQEPSSEDIQQQSFDAWVKGMELDLEEKTGEPVIDDTEDWFLSDKSYEEYFNEEGEK